MESLCVQEHEQISAFKFADDGTIKVTGRDLNECLYYLEIALDSIGGWTSKWRMVINCNTNKTEVICFSCKDIAAVPTTFQLCGNTIQLTDSSKVLGITIDRRLNYRQHSQNVLNNLMYRWVCISRYTNRNWGLNQRVLVRLTKTVIFSCLFYGSLIWQNNTNLVQLNKFWYKVAKSAVGAVFNIQQAIAEAILGVPPLSVTGRILAVKHYLKALSNTDDIHKRFLLNEVTSKNPVVLSHMKDIIRFIKWKHEYNPGFTSPSDTELLNNGFGMEDLFKLTKRTCHYSRGLIDKFTELLWQESIKNQLQLEGWPIIPRVSLSPLPLPHGTSREQEVLIMSLLYKNNLLNSFLSRLDRTRWNSSLCSCGCEDQTVIHLLTRCLLIEDTIRDQASYLLTTGNEVNMEKLDDLGPVAALLKRPQFHGSVSFACS
ncbi:hypothetical protein ACHWQZ_G010771 [Mnemiopsis leidyi]